MSLTSSWNGVNLETNRTGVVVVVVIAPTVREPTLYCLRDEFLAAGEAALTGGAKNADPLLGMLTCPREWNQSLS